MIAFHGQYYKLHSAIALCTSILHHLLAVVTAETFPHYNIFYIDFLNPSYQLLKTSAALFAW
jgi:hypothetical protein